MTIAEPDPSVLPTGEEPAEYVDDPANDPPPPGERPGRDNAPREPEAPTR